MTSVHDSGVGSAGPLGPGMYDTGRYHMYIGRHVASPSLKPAPEVQRPMGPGGRVEEEGHLGEGEQPARRRLGRVIVRDPGLYLDLDLDLDMDMDSRCSSGPIR